MTKHRFNYFCSIFAKVPDLFGGSATRCPSFGSKSPAKQVQLSILHSGSQRWADRVLWAFLGCYLVDLANRLLPGWSCQSAATWLILPIGCYLVDPANRLHLVDPANRLIRGWSCQSTATWLILPINCYLVDPAYRLLPCWFCQSDWPMRCMETDHLDLEEKDCSVHKSQGCF